MVTINVLEWLENAVRQAGDQVAFDMPGEALTWGQLQQRALEIGSAIAEKKEQQSPVLILMEKSPSCVAAMLGAVYAGCFYTPLDSSMPKSRMQMIADTLQPAVVLCECRFLEIARSIAPDALILVQDEIHRSVNHELLSRRRKLHIDQDLLYVLFTSGSTGTPKGVSITHRSVIDFISWACDALELPLHCRFGNQAPLYFDNSVLDIYGAMHCAGSVHLIQRMLFMFPSRLIATLQQERIDTIFWVPSALTMVVKADVLQPGILPELKRIFFCGEVMPCSTYNLWKKAVPDADYVNMYGPTEITDVCAWYRVNRSFQDTDVMPIGHPCANTRIELINGEICVSGTCLSPGYYRDQEKTKAVFVQRPGSARVHELMYKTGDLGAWNDRGELMFIGRRDSQIKRNGYRIELGEIECAICALDGVQTGCCLYDAQHECILCAWTGEISAAAVKRALKDRIPKYMMPDVWMPLDVIPQTGNGKIDRLGVFKLYQESLHKKESP